MMCSTVHFQGFALEPGTSLWKRQGRVYISEYTGPGQLWGLTVGLCDLMPEKSLFQASLSGMLQA